jgi:plasmid stabilization system protein ParE
MSGFVLHPDAFLDIDEIREYLAARSPDSADRVVTEIFTAIRNLVPFPHRGFHLPHLSSHSVRFALVREYLIAYVPDAVPLQVLAVLHGRRSPRILAAVLRGRQ